MLSKKGISTSSDNEQGVQVDDRSGTESNQQPSSNGDDVGKSIEKTQSTGDETGSENAVNDWASIVRKLTSDTDKVLITLRETEWKETGGAFTKEVIGGLDLLQTNYFVLYDQKAPIEYVEQSRKEIAKAIFEANIIPNICGVLTDLYVQNLALSASHKYDVVTNNAIIIINNYAKYDNTEEYTKAIAICPGFLEFLREQFASSSAKYLQLHEQVRISLFSNCCKITTM